MKPSPSDIQSRLARAGQRAKMLYISLEAIAYSVVSEPDRDALEAFSLNRGGARRRISRDSSPATEAGFAKGASSRGCPMTTTTFSPEELLESRIPTVEDKLNDIETALALAALLSRAMAQTNGDVSGVCLASDIEARAHSKLADLYQEAYLGLQMVVRVLPTEATFVRADDNKAAGGRL
jgi:hypothetical protein